MLSPYKKWSMVIICVGVIALYLHLFESDGTLINREQLLEVESIEEVKEFFYTKNPGLKRAERLEVVNTSAVVLPVPNSKYTLYIDQIWYGEEIVHIYYSIDLGRDIHRLKYSDESSSIFPWVHFSFDPIEVESRNWNNQVYFNRLGPTEGIIYKKRLYHQVAVGPLLDVDWNKPREVEKALLRDLRIEIIGKSFEMGDVELTIGYGAEETPRINVPLDLEMDIENGKLQIERLDIGVYDQRLYFNIKNIKEFPYDPHLSTSKAPLERAEWEGKWKGKEPLVIEIRNEHDEAVRWNYRGQGPGERLQISIDEEELNKAKTLHVTLHQLPFKKIYDWSATVDVDSEDQY